MGAKLNSKERFKSVSYSIKPSLNALIVPTL